MKRQSVLDALFLVATTALAAWLRLRQLAVPSLWLDEIIDYDVVSMIRHQPLWRWFDIFEAEHGPLFFATELAGRVFHGPEFAARIAPAIVGIVAIPLAWIAARAITSFRPAPYAFAILLAVSPLAVYYSRDARPYALVVLIAIAFLALLLRDAKWEAAAALLIAAFYTSATIAAVVVAVIVAAAIARNWRVAGAAVLCAIGIAFCYRPSVNLGHQEFPSATEVLQSLSAHGRIAYVFLALALIGAVALWMKNRTQAATVLTMTIIPLAIPIAASWYMHHFFNVRYVIGALPGYLLLVAIGVATIVRIPIAAIVAAALLVQPGWDAAIREPFHKLDWRAIAQSITRHAHASDIVIASNRWTFVSLGFYLRGLEPHVHLIDADEGTKGPEVIAYTHTTTWIAVAGGFGGSNFPQWACRFPVLLASPIEDFRLHYSPDAFWFLMHRSTPAERRALIASFAGAPSIHFGPGDDALLGPGWSGAEPEEGRWARWAIGKQSFAAIPSLDARRATITIDVAPVSVLKQTMNGIPLAPGRHPYSFPFDLKAGMNMLQLDWGASVAPADVDPKSTDHRQLAARVYEIRVDTGSASTTHVVRIDAPDISWHNHDGRPLPPNSSRVLGRMGLDPQRDFHQSLANLAVTIADDSVCMDDEHFLRRLFGALLNRDITDRDMRNFKAQIASGVSRRTIAWRLGNSDEVKSRLRE
ncbi:MAG TPA: glycosyltransferase family 39 protein [Thermoanaerobaculia bacterium]|nr:glycosyltransferase family 39 protein [Thermoanaerobaculia bacterium]